MTNKRILNWFFHSKDDRNFLNKNIKKRQTGPLSKKIIVQFQAETIFLERFFRFSNNYKIQPHLLDLTNPHHSITDVLVFPIYIFKIIEQFFLTRKTCQLYDRFYDSQILKPKYSFLKTFKFLPKSVNLFCKLKNNKDLLKVKYSGIVIGDLLYDTYLRFYKKSTLNVNDFNLIFLFARTFYEIKYLENLSSKIDLYLTGYCTYTNSGLPVRVFLNRNVEVYSFSNMMDGKKLSLQDYLQVKPHWNYKSNFSLLQNKNEKIQQGLNLIKNRMNGQMDLSYMKHNPYLIHNKKAEFINSFDGVMFLHDFTDSYHIYRTSLFCDFLEWTEFTLNLIRLNSLKIGIKPHPNQNPTSKKITRSLIKKYNDLNWIDESISNKTIFSSGISFGISIYGTVLSELAFNKIISICCGDNPTSNYNFTFNAKTIDDYKNLILNYKSLTFKDNVDDQIGEFMFMHYLN